MDGRAPSGGLVARLPGDPVLWLILAVTLARIAYLLWFCPYELVEDEAHYWEWSRRLGLSYYTKGPGVAWAIAASIKLLGTSEFAVRLPSVLASGIGAWAVARLARDAFNDRRAGLYAAALYNLAPVFQFASLLMTIDSPYVACWAVATWAAWRAIRTQRPSLGFWTLLGAALGIGFLFKYTILLLVPGVIAGAVLAGRHDRRTGQPGTVRTRPIAGLMVSTVVFLLCASPVFIWNTMEGWPTVRHLMGHLGLAGGDITVKPSASPGWNYEPRWTLEFLGVQLVLLGAPSALVIGAIGAVWKRRIPEDRRAASLFMLACAVPIFAFYLVVSFLTSPEGNWPMAGFTPLLVLAAFWTSCGQNEFDRRCAAERSKPKMFIHDAWKTSLWVGIIVAALMLRADLLTYIPGIGPKVPIGRLIGASTQAAHIEELRGSLQRQTGQEPLIIVQHYGQASRLAYYLDSRPVVFCASSYTGGRKTQYDYWPDTDLGNPELKGRPAILVGGERSQWLSAFDRVEPIGALRGETKKDRSAFVGYGFRGFRKR